LLILAETNLVGSERLTEKVINAISTHNFEFDNNTLQVTMSFGVACYAKKD
jgi:GGDEF domain-containing protein